MPSGRLNIPKCTRVLRHDLFGSEPPHFTRRNSRNEGPRRDNLAGTNHSPRGDKRVLPDLSAIENDRADPDQRAISNTAAVNHGLMPDGDVVPEDGWKAALRDMHGRLVLNICSFTDSDMMHVAA